MRRNLELALSILGIIVIGAGLWLLLVRPMNNKATAAGDRENAAVSRAASLRNEIRSLEELQRNAPALQQRQKALAGVFPTSPNLAKLTDALQQTADQAGVELVSIQPGAAAKAQPSDQVATITTQLEVRGPYFKVEDYVNRLEELVRSAGETGVPARALLLQSVDLRPYATSSDSGDTASLSDPDVLTARLTVVAYQVVKDSATMSPTPATSGTNPS